MVPVALLVRLEAKADRACEDRSYDVLYLNVDPVFDVPRNDPRFPALVRKVNLPEITR